VKRVLVALVLSVLAGSAAAQEAAPDGSRDGVATLQGYAAFKMGDYQKALEIWKPLAEKGSTAAQLSLGAMYEQGQGVAQDYAEAARWYGRAAAGGHASAQYNLALLYETGRGVPRDLEKAAYWFRKAAEQGDRDSAYNLGVMYATGFGKGVTSDPKEAAEALKWLGRAADKGHPQAASMAKVVGEAHPGVVAAP
jgi:TPR repeat protein